MAGMMKQEVSFFSSLKVWIRPDLHGSFKQQQSGRHLGLGGILGAYDIAEKVHFQAPSR